MNFISNIFKGIALGAGAILPGISSGVLCVIFGIYEKLLDGFLYFFKDIRNNIKFLLPLIFGIGLGVFLFSNFLQFFFATFPIQTNSIFIGLILGTIPSLIKSLKIKKDTKNISIYLCFFSFFICFFIGILSVILESVLPNSTVDNVSFLYLVLAGFLMSIGVVVPGVSSTIILMLLGVYSIYLNSISTLSFSILIPMGIGLILGSFVFMKLIKILLDKFHNITFSGIIGFSLGSIFVIFPSFNSMVELFIILLCILLGYTTSSLFTIR